jgi:hypothetical protein
MSKLRDAGIAVEQHAWIRFDIAILGEPGAVEAAEELAKIDLHVPRRAACERLPVRYRSHRWVAR